MDTFVLWLTQVSGISLSTFQSRNVGVKHGGGTPFYGLYGYVRPQRVWFFRRFGRKLGIDFSHFAATLVINRE